MRNGVTCENTRNRIAAEAPPIAPTRISMRTKCLDEAVVKVARQPRADAHREQVGANDGRELRDGVAEKITRERAGNELVDQPAARDHERREQQRGADISHESPLR